MAAIVAPVSLQSMAAEIVGEIMVVAMEECSWRAVFPLCSTSRYLRRVALSTSALWMSFTATCRFHQTTDGGPHVTIRDMELIEWWYEKAERRNAFVLDFDFKPVAREDRTDWTPLSGPALRTIVNLLTHARFLRAGSAALSVLCAVFMHPNQSSPEKNFDDINPVWAPAPFSFLDSIVIQNTYRGGGRMGAYESDLWNLLAVFEMPALRKCVLNGLVLWYPFDLPAYPDGRTTSFAEVWGRLTHVRCAFQGTRERWREFVGGMPSVINARIDLELTDAHHAEVQPAAGVSVPDCTLANLSELSLKIECRSEVYDVGIVLDGLYLPGVKTLMISAPRVTLVGLRRILGATRMVERIRLSAVFPVLDLNVNRVEFHATNDRLANHAPNLRKLMIDIPHIRQFEGSFRGYVEGMTDSGWLRGRWRNAPLRVEFYQPKRVLAMCGMIEDLKIYLESPGAPTVGDLGQVDVSFRGRSYAGAEELQAQQRVPVWDLWFDLVEQFD